MQPTRILPRTVWLLSGIIGGIGLAYFWPHETAYSMATDRNEKFAICTVQTGPASPDAVFVLDFTTGRLQGGLLNPGAGQFTNFWYADVAKHFGVGTKGKFTIIPGQGFLNAPANSGGGALATGLIYVGEITSGKVGCYRFSIKNGQGGMPPEELDQVAWFPFRETK